MRARTIAAAIFALNVWIAAPLFVLEDSAHLGSIEVAFIAIAERMIAAFPDFGWWREWYMGIPFQNSYPPLLHAGVAAVAAATPMSTALSYHLVTASLYALGPVTLFALMRRLGGGNATAAASAILYSVLSPSSWLIESVRHDAGSIWHARRFQALVFYGEGPHVAAMALLPLAILALDLALEKRRWMLGAAVAMAAVVLTNWLGGFALAAAVVSYLFARRATWRDWLTACIAGALAFALALPWIPPSTLSAIRDNAQWIGGDFRFGARNAAALVTLFAIAWLSTRLSKQTHFGFAAAFSILMGGITLAAEWGKFFVLPQPQRYHLEMEMAFSWLAAAMAVPLLQRLDVRRTAVATVSVIALAYPAYRYQRHVRALVQPIPIETTSEYKVAKWFEANMNGRRVMAPGSIQFAMSRWTSTPQLGGGFDQGISNPMLPKALFQILSGMNAGEREGQVATDWLRAFGVHAVAVSAAGSTEAFKPFANPKKFDDLLEVLWRDGGDTVYRVPQRSESLARVVRVDDLVMTPIEYATETGRLERYLRAIDDRSLPDASWQWDSPSSATITGILRPDQVLSIAIAYHPGWSASVGVDSLEQTIAVQKDALGMIFLEPRCNGGCHVTLTFGEDGEALLARIVSIVALIVGLVITLRG